MRPSLLLLLILLAADQFVQADQVPRIEIAPSYSMSVLDVTVIQHGPLVSISGHVRRSEPWAESTPGYLEISLFDRVGGLIRKFETKYSPRQCRILIVVRTGRSPDSRL